MAKILVAAPDARRRRELAEAFRVAGHAVQEAADAAECLESLERRVPEALVLDPALPGMEEFRLLHRLRRDPALAPLKISLLARGMTPALWEHLGRQFFDLVVEEEGPAAAGALAAGVEGGAPARRKPAKRKGEGKAEARRILVVEDEPTYCLLLGTQFQAMGWTTLGADSAEAALAILAKEEVDAVLSDINLPGMKGTDLAESVLRFHPGVKVVLMTGMPRERCPRAPASVPILPKPISVRELMNAMRFLPG